MKKKICEWCNEEFVPTSGRQRYCTRDHIATCSICGKQYRINQRDLRDNRFFCSRECALVHRNSMLSDNRSSIESKRQETCKILYGVSNPMENLDIKCKSVRNRIQTSKCIFPSDIKQKSIQRYLNQDVMHQNRMVYINGIQVYPWENYDLIRGYTDIQYEIDASDCTMLMVYKHIADEFLNAYDVYGTDSRNELCIGLVYNRELVQVLTIGRSKNPDFMYQIYRVCTKPGYMIINGYERMLEYAVQDFEVSSIVAYDIISKSNKNLFEQIGMKHRSTIPSMKVWCFGDIMIPDDQIFNRDLSKMFHSSNKLDKQSQMKMHQWSEYTLRNIRVFSD